MERNNPGKIQKQVKLPLKEAVKISARSIRIRLGRSLITLGGILFAIAFLMSIFTSAIITDSLIHQGSPKIKTRLLQLQGEEESIYSLGPIKLTPRQLWLVSLSLLVCVVGIANAMLMSVTERYREIGTMKCLGALNRFIIEIFLLESGFQGIVGSLVGVILGFVGMFLLNLIKYGGEVITTFAGVKMLSAGIIAIVLGAILSVVGAIYPAYRAARMVPADAMRTEI